MVYWAVINVALSVAFFLLIRSNLMRFYLLLNYVLIVNPAFIWAFLGEAHPLFIPGSPSYETALAYMAMFNIVLCGSFMFFLRYLPNLGVIRRNLLSDRLNSTEHISRVVLSALLLFGMGLLGKLLLDGMGALRMLDVGGEGPLLQALKVFAGFDILALLVLGEVRHSHRAHIPVLLPLIGVSFVVAMISGSRAQTITILIIMMIVYRSTVRKYWYLVYPAVVAAMPLVFYIFPLLGFYRISNHNFAEANYLVQQMEITPSQIMVDVFVTRLNYLEPLARVIDFVARDGPAGGSVYWNNIIGVVPRLIWPGKPEISNDSQFLGHQLGLVTLNDESTSIGLQVVGESFFEYGWIGLWVAVFQALIFAFGQRIFYRPGNPAAMGAYTMFCIYILQRDGYFAVVPGLIYLLIGFFFFFGVFGLLLRSRRRTTSIK